MKLLKNCFTCWFSVTPVKFNADMAIACCKEDGWNTLLLAIEPEPSCDYWQPADWVKSEEDPDEQ